MYNVQTTKWKQYEKVFNDGREKNSGEKESNLNLGSEREQVKSDSKIKGELTSPLDCNKFTIFF